MKRGFFDRLIGVLLVLGVIVLIGILAGALFGWWSVNCPKGEHWVLVGKVPVCMR